MPSDEALAAAFCGGDDQAYTQLYLRWRVALFGFAARMLGNPEAARDVVQDTFVTLWERREDAGGLRSVRGWMFTAARNRCLGILRQRQTRARLDALGEVEEPAVPDVAALTDDDAVRQVRAAVLELPAEQREVLVLREYQECSYEEIAEITRSTVSAVKSRLFRARRALAVRLRPVLTQGDEP